MPYFASAASRFGDVCFAHERPGGGSALPVKSCGVDPIEKEVRAPNDRQV
jgi:hypothetical protein